jgi:uncharacterized protein DUF748
MTITSSNAGPREGRNKLLYIVGGILAFLLIAHVVLPFAIRGYVVRTLNKIPGYRAEVGRLYVNLFRGAYQIKQIKLEKTAGSVPVPFFSADTIDLSIQWTELFHGALVGQIQVDRPSLNFVNSPSPETSQASVDKSWIEHVKELFPLKINRFEIDDGEIHFRDFSRKPNVDLYMTKTRVVAINLTNSRRLSQTLVATIDAAGIVPQNGRFKFHLEADPLAERPTFKLAAEMTEVDLTQWNNFLETYGGVDAAKGTFSVFTEMQVERGKVQGYIKPILNHLEISRWKEAHENPLKVIWETIVAGVAEILKNQPKDQIATRIPLSGDISNPDAGIFATIGNLLRNAYIQALFPSFDGYLGRGSTADGNITTNHAP